MLMQKTMAALLEFQVFPQTSVSSAQVGDSRECALFWALSLTTLPSREQWQKQKESHGRCDNSDLHKKSQCRSSEAQQCLETERGPGPDPQLPSIESEPHAWRKSLLRRQKQLWFYFLLCLIMWTVPASDRAWDSGLRQGTEPSPCTLLRTRMIV